MLELRLPTITLRALTWGDLDDHDRPLTVLLHGFPDTAHTWRFLGPVLADQGYRVVAPFTRGYGPSDLAADGCYHVAALASDAVEIHRVLAGDDRAVLVGHDWGAITANALAAYPDQPFARIASLAVPPIPAVAAARHGVGTTLALAGSQVAKSWYIAFHQLPALPERAFDRYVPWLWRHWSPGYEGSQDLAWLAESLAGEGRRAAVIGYYRAPRRPGKVPAAYAGYAQHWLGPMRAPVLSLAGADDGCLDVRHAVGAADHLYPGSRFALIEGAGHFLHLEKPDEVAAEILAYLEQCPTSRPDL